MKKNLKPLLMSALVATSMGAQAESLEDRVENLETNALLNAIQWNGSFSTSFDSIKSETTTSGTKTEIDNNPMRAQVAFDATAEVSNKVTFYSRFGASKFFNTVDYAAGDAGFANASRDEQGLEMYLERAYLNYKMMKGLTFSIGRLPTVDGAPAEMYDDLPRQGTYPFLAYGSQLDGMALTYSAGFMPQGHSLSLRGVYTPLFNLKTDATTGSLVDPVRDGGLNAPKMKEQTALFTGMIEYQNKASSMWDDLLAIFQYNKIQAIQLASNIDKGTSAQAVAISPGLGGDGINTSFNPTGTSALTLTEKFAGSNLQFDLQTMTANFGLKNIANTGINFGFTYYKSEVESQGFSETNTSILTDFSSKVSTALQAAGKSATEANATAAAQAAALGKQLGIGKGVLTDSAKATIKGAAWMTQISYKLPVAFLKKPTFGVEYFKGDKELVNFTSNSEDLTGFYQTRGKAYHIWYTQPLDYSMKLRVGYRNQDHDYSKGLLGAPTAVDMTEKTMYATLRLTF